MENEFPTKHFVSPEKMPLLLELTKKLYLSLNLEDVLKNVLFLSIQLVDADGGSIMLIDRKTKKLSIARAVSLDEEIVKTCSLRTGERVAGWVVEQKMPVTIQGNVRNHPHFSSILDGPSDIRSSMCIPLKVNDTVVGVISLKRMIEGSFPEFDDADLRLAVTFARYCAAALQNARLCETLLNQNKQLAVIDKTMSDATAELCHEMRTPLSAVVACISNLLEGTLGKLNDKQKEKLQNAKEHCDRMLHLLEDLTSASDRKMSKEVLQPGKLIQSCISAVETFYEAKRINLASDVPQKMPDVIGDRLKVEQVLINLLVNACKYSDAGANTVVSACEKEGDVEFCVLDTGRGIPDQHLEKIFEEFYRVESDKQEPGIGLGLAISKKMIEGLGGKIWAESEVGVGSKFLFTLPTKEKAEKLNGRQETSTAEDTRTEPSSN